MVTKTRTDMNEKPEVERLCKQFKGDLITYPDGSYRCAGVLDATIDFEMGKVDLKHTGGKSRLSNYYELLGFGSFNNRLGSGTVDFSKPAQRLGSGSIDFAPLPGMGKFSDKAVHIPTIVSR